MVTISSLKSLFGKNKITVEGQPTLTVDFEAITGVTNTHTQIVTNRPVEKGYNQTDAIHQNPPLATISILITDTPQSVLDYQKVSALANVLGFNLLNSHVSKQLNALEEMYNSKLPITITSKYRQYKNYYITERSYEEGEDEGIVVNLSIMKRRENIEDLTAEKYSNAIGPWS